ncbi:MAG TPA: hypothetical protein VLG44_01880, partial [Chlamydiales bacterium]|nr:hypothetical protein [Chlamydiales bacterium]
MKARFLKTTKISVLGSICLLTLFQTGWAVTTITLNSANINDTVNIGLNAAIKQMNATPTTSYIVNIPFASLTFAAPTT